MQESARELSRGNVQMDITDIPFPQIPHQTRLFLDYISNPLSLKTFYPNVVAKPGQLDDYAARVLSSYSVDRGPVCNALEQINQEAGACERTFENIKKLRDDDCVAVLTGQQVGLFSGPLYTIYKALSAVRLADDLTKQGVKAVPIFWAATEDHDFQEIATTFVPNTLTYSADPKLAGLPVGSIDLRHDVANVVDDLFEGLRSSEFSTELRSIVEASYVEGTSIGPAFIKLLAQILADRGIIFIDPMDPAVRELSAPLILSAIQNAKSIGESLLDRTRELEKAGYPAQVLIEEDHFPLFWIDEDGKRTALRLHGENFRAKGSRLSFSTDELLSVASQDPERLSPSVMLRPVVQDFLLPTVAYLGGAAEVAYFAQNSVVYSCLDRPVTPIFHRQSFTVIEPKMRRSLDKFHLTLTDLFNGREELFLKAAAELDADAMGQLFADAEERINTELNRLDQRISSLDPTVATNLATRRRKIIYHIGALKKKTLLATIRKDETSHRQINELFDILLPNGALQERSLNVLYFLTKYGPQFIDWVYSATDVNNTTHRVLDLK
jgi:bacillithiol synthase